jgi:Tfp pilus assembly protein PilF
MSKANSKPSSKPATSPVNKLNRNIYILLVVWCFILYGNTIRNDYALDDVLVTAQNQVVAQGIKAIPEIFTSFYYETSGNAGTLAFGYRPITKATFAIEASFFGENPHVGHFINILLYALTAIVLFRVLRLMFKSAHYLFPLAITLLFISHPIHTEVVASLKNREEILGLLGALLGLQYFIKFTTTGRRKYVIYGFLWFLFGYMSKSSVLSFLALYPLVLYFFTDIKIKPLLYVIAGSVLVILLAQFLPKLFLPDAIRPNDLVENPLFFEKNLLLRFGTGMTGLLYYLRLLIWPDPLLFYYGYDTFPVTGPGNLTVIIAVMIHLAMLVWALMNLTKKHLLSFAILFYLISISMYANFVSPAVGIVADRFVYVASLGFAVALAFFIFKALKIQPVQLLLPSKTVTRIVTVLIVILIPFAALTINRNNDWKDLATLYQADIGHLDRSVKANTQYAGNLFYNSYVLMNQEKSAPSEEKVKTMIKHYELALDVLPTYYDALNGLGSVYATILGRQDMAVPYFERAIQSDPKNVAAYVNLAFAYRDKKDFDKAAFYYEKVIEMDSTKIKAYYNLAQIYFDKGDFNRAVEYNKKAMRVNPNTEEPYLNIGNFYLMSHDTVSAVSWYEQAVEKQPVYETSNNLYQYYRQMGNTEKAEYYRLKAEESKNVRTVKMP